MKKYILATLMLVMFVTLSNAQGIAGVWKTIDDENGKEKSHLELYEQNGKVYGKIVKLLQVSSDKLCEKCTGDNKNKPLMGMVLLSGLYAKDGMWTGGTIMDPNKGSNYGCSLWFEQGNSDILNVRGKHWSGLYRTQKWYRVTGK